MIEKHVWKTIKGLPWSVCRYCGLVALGNDLTKWCIKMGCEHTEHPEYKSKLKAWNTQ